MQTLLPVTQAPKTPSTTPSVSSGNSTNKNSEMPKDKFDKILQREVSETSNKQETSQKTIQTDTSTPSDSSKPATESNHDSSDQPTNSTVDNVLATTETKYQSDQALYSIAIVPNTNPLASEPITFPAVSSSPELTTALTTSELTTTTAPPTALPTALPTTPVLATVPTSTISTELPTAPILNDKNLIGDGKSPQNAPSLMNPIMLQKSLPQSTFNENNFSRTSPDFLQSLNTVNSADFGKLFPISPDSTKSLAAQFDKTLIITPIESTDHPLVNTNTLSSLTPTHVNNTPTHDIHVDSIVGQPKWGNEFAQKIVWMNNQQQQVAEIRLNPANLGPVEVMLSITQDQATAQFISPHASVREAIQDALPRLKEMLADSGIQLGNVTVGAESSQQEHKQQQGYNPLKNSFDRTLSGTQTSNANEVTHTMPVRHHGIVNTFA